MRIRIAIGITILGAVIFVATTVRAFFYNPEIEVPMNRRQTQGVERKIASPLHPSRLIIPRIQVNAVVQNVGLGKTGNMAVPTNYSDVGWYKYGTLPGNPGSAVIDGHVQNGFGLAGVFYNLKKLAPGDDVYVASKDGSRLHFVVTAVKSYEYDEVPTEAIFSDSDTPRLNLITCDGTWSKESMSYDHRLIVFTKLVDSEK